MQNQIFQSITLSGYESRGKPFGGVCPLLSQDMRWAHYPRQIPSVGIKQKPLRNCKFCLINKKKSKSHWECEKCDVALHVPECFKLYHEPRRSCDDL